MKTRIISSLVALVILAAILSMYNTFVFNIAIAAISVTAVCEAMKVAGIKNPILVGMGVVIAAVMPFARFFIGMREQSIVAIGSSDGSTTFFISGNSDSSMFYSNITAVFIIAAMVFLFVMLFKHAAVCVEQVGMAFFLSLVIPIFFSTSIYIRDSLGSQAGMFLLFFAMTGAWLCDSCAYFVGRKFGRRKLAPIISPKKTIEGAIGGIVIATILMLLMGMVYAHSVSSSGVDIYINYPAIAIFAPIVCVMGIFGDLSASVIKRRFGAKDYGNIMPGHGGVLDRCDSFLFTMPTVYVLARYVVFVGFGA